MPVVPLPPSRTPPAGRMDSGRSGKWMQNPTALSYIVIYCLELPFATDPCTMPFFMAPICTLHSSFLRHWDVFCFFVLLCFVFLSKGPSPNHKSGTIEIGWKFPFHFNMLCIINKISLGINNKKRRTGLPMAMHLHALLRGHLSIRTSLC